MHLHAFNLLRYLCKDEDVFLKTNLVGVKILKSVYDQLKI